MLISSPRIPTPISTGVAAIALPYGVSTVFAPDRHEEYWAPAVALSFAIYPRVPKLPQQPEAKPVKCSLFGPTRNDL